MIADVLTCAGANFNAMIGLTSPGKVGADVCHLNLVRRSLSSRPALLPRSVAHARRRS